MTRVDVEAFSISSTLADFCHIRAGGQPDGHDPYPTFRRLRELAPVWHSPWGDWYALSFAAVSKAATDRSLRRSPEPGSSNTIGGITTLTERVSSYLRERLLFSDPPTHSHLRGVILTAFQPADAAALAPEIKALTRSLIERMPPEAGEVVRSLTRPLPINIISSILGIPEADRERLADWATIARNILDTGVEEHDATAAAAAGELQQYFLDLVRDGRWLATESGNRFAPLVQAFPAEAVAANLSMLALISNDTTVHLIGNMLLHLALRPELWHRLRSERSLVPAVVAETRRFESPVQRICRWAVGDVDLGGTRVPDGALITLLIGAANRDPAKYPNPDLFDVDRKMGTNLAFGRGAICVSAAHLPWSKRRACCGCSSTAGRMSTSHRMAGLGTTTVPSEA